MNNNLLLHFKILLASGYNSYARRILFFLYLIPLSFYSQNTPVKHSAQLNNVDFSVVEILFEQYVEIEIDNSVDDQVYMYEEENGEYKNVTSVGFEVKNDTLKIGSFTDPNFEFPQDKLSAHKVIDTKVKLLVPKKKDLFIKANEASCSLGGSYNRVFVDLLSGRCELKDLKSDIEVVMVYGDITIDADFYQIKYKSAVSDEWVLEVADLVKYEAVLQTLNGIVRIGS